MSTLTTGTKVAVAVIAVVALKAGAVEFTNADGSGDLASPGAWAGGVVPTNAAIHFTNVTGTVSASADVKFKTANFVNTAGTAANPISLTFDMRNEATAAEPGPRKVNLWSLDVKNGRYYTIALKGGEWDFNAGGQWVTYNHVHLMGGDDTTITSNRVVISDGAVLKGMVPNYSLMERQRRSSIALTGQSSFTISGTCIPFDRGRENAIEVRDGSTLKVGILKFGCGGTSSFVSSNRIVVTGSESLMRVSGSYQADGCAIGYSKDTERGCAANILEVKDRASFLARTTSGDNTVQIGMQTPYNEVRVDSGASMAAGNLRVGAGSGASRNLLFVGNEASYSCSESAYSPMYVGYAAGANENRIVVSNGTLSGKCFRVGHAESSGNAVEILGPKANVVLDSDGNHNGFFRDGSHDNLVALSCTTQDWSAAAKGPYRLTIGGIDDPSKTERPASNNVFRLARAAQVSLESLKVGWTNGVGTVSNPGNALEISDTARVLLRTLVCYPENTIRLKVPEGGYEKTPVSGSLFSMYAGSVLDVDVSAWTKGPTRCVLFKSPDWTEWIGSIDPSVIAAANEKLAGKARLYWRDRQTLMIARKTGLSIVVR